MDKLHTGLAAEFFVAGELARRGYNVTITFGNTKSIDLLIEKNGRQRMLQVKGIKQRKNNNFRIRVDKLKKNAWYILVNINRVNYNLNCEYSILSYTDVLRSLRRPITKYDNAIRVSILDNKRYKNKWSRLY